ncbi:MAG: RND family transporter [Pseudomonadales bacterium]
MLFGWIRNHSSFIYGLVVLGTALSLVGTSGLSVTPDNRVFYGPSNTYFNDVLEFEANYTPNNNILYVIHGTSSIEEGSQIEAIQWLTDKAWRIHNTIRVDSISSYPVALGQENVIEVLPLSEVACPDLPTCNTGDLEVLRKPQILNRLISKDLHSAGVVATVTLDRSSEDTIKKITDDAESLAAEFRDSFPDLELVVTGGVPMMQAMATYSAEDLGTLLPIALGIVLVLLTLFLGGLAPAFCVLGVAFLAVLTTMGFAGWTGHQINSATSIVPLVVFTLVVTSSMHIMVHFVRLMAVPGASAVESTQAALQGNLVPMLVSSSTTAVGLLSLLFLDSPPFKELGYLSAFGVASGTALSILLLPLVLQRLSNIRSSAATAWLQERLNDYARFVESGRTLTVPTLAVMSVSTIGLFSITLDDNFVEYFSETTDFRRNTDRATELLAGPNHIEIVLENGADNGVFDPSYIAYLERLTTFVRDQAYVSNASSFSDVLHDLSEAFGTSLASVSSADELAQWYLVYELSLRRGQSNTDFVRADQKQTRMSVLLNETTSTEIQELESAIYRWHEANNSPFKLKVTGENIPVAYLSKTNIQSMVSGIFLSIAFTSLAIGFVVKKLRLGVATLLATVLPIVFGFGIWGFFNDTIGLASTAIIALTIGIVVDDAAHMVYRFVDARQRLDSDSWQAAGFSIHRVGIAVSATSVVMVGGLAALLFSSFELNSSFGECTCLIIGMALVFDLFALPGLLVWADH